jgi:hypothetical protein
MSTTFTLWHPIINSNQLECYFDVRPYDFEQLDKGSQTLMEQFLQCLGIDALPASWHIEPFCSPYYSGSMEASNWLDRYPLAWRVHVTFTDTSAEMTKPRFFGPYSCDGIDPSWQEQEDSWEWSSQICVVIADFLDEQWETSLKDFEQELVFRHCKRIDSFQLTPRIVQGRFDMGQVSFPDNEKQVEALIEACKLRSSSVNWATSLHLAQCLSEN